MITKGDWKVTSAVPTLENTLTVYCEGRRIAIVMAGKDMEANANLIAAAPDGLEAGIDAYVALLRTTRMFRITIQRELCQLRDFIAKATNQSSEDVQNEYEAQALAKVEGGK